MANRWDALDVLRGLTIILMLMNLTPGSWDAKGDTRGDLMRQLVAAAVVVVISYWLLLYFVPVPGFGAPRFDPVGSWPSVIDRAVIGVQHFFPYWPVDGQVVFDPEGILSTCAASLLFALCGIGLIILVLLVCHRKRWILKL
jgi:predicted acyltransferase